MARQKWRVRQKIRSRLQTIDGKGPWPGFGWSPRAARRGRQLLRIGLRRSSLLLGEFSKPARCRNPERSRRTHGSCSKRFKNQKELVGATGFEPVTPCAQGRCATRLRYAPTELLL